MIIIGEKINATRKQVAQAIQAHDAAAIETLAKVQAEAGATYLDVNGGDPRKEVENLSWLIDAVQSATDRPIAIDSANPAAVEAGLKKVKHKPLLNSVSLEKSRMDAVLPLAKNHECSLVALLVNDKGVPTGIDDRLMMAEELVGKLIDIGKKEDEIFVDPCFLTVYTEPNAGLDLLQAIRGIRKRWPGIHISGGVSNASHGLPERKWINQAYLLLAMGAGLDAAIIDPTAEGTLALVRAAEVILNRDEMAMNYIAATRKAKS
jgi:5-methyltetrahydrofolate--homocysteine methyltransferase